MACVSGRPGGATDRHSGCRGCRVVPGARAGRAGCHDRLSRRGALWRCACRKPARSLRADNLNRRRDGRHLQRRGPDAPGQEDDQRARHVGHRLDLPLPAWPQSRLHRGRRHTGHRADYGLSQSRPRGLVGLPRTGESSVAVPFRLRVARDHSAAGKGRPARAKPQGPAFGRARQPARTGLQAQASPRPRTGAVPAPVPAPGTARRPGTAAAAIQAMAAAAIPAAEPAASTPTRSRSVR